jgi:hypothetical protein
VSCGWPHTMHPYASLPRADTGAGRHGCGSTSTDALRRRRAPWLTTSVRRWWMSTSALMRWKHHSCGFRRRERPFFCCREEKTPLFCFVLFVLLWPAQRQIIARSAPQKTIQCAYGGGGAAVYGTCEFPISPFSSLGVPAAPTCHSAPVADGKTNERHAHTRKHKVAELRVATNKTA